jgi:predicted kinase
MASHIPENGDLIQNKHGIWYARMPGKRMTPNTPRAARDLLDEMRIDAARPAVKPQGGDVIILRGLPGSGKTTWARDFIQYRHWYRRISKDSLREMFAFGYYAPKNEKILVGLRNALLIDVLREHPHAILDDTNLTDRHVRDIKEHSIGWWNGAPRISIEILEFHTPLDECVRRDALREKPVGADRICEMNERWQRECEADTDEARAIMAQRIEELRERPEWARDDDE